MEWERNHLYEMNEMIRKPTDHGNFLTNAVSYDAIQQFMQNSLCTTCNPVCKLPTNESFSIIECRMQFSR